MTTDMRKQVKCQTVSQLIMTLSLVAKHVFFSCRGVSSSSIPYAGGAQGGGGGCKVPQRRAAQAWQHAEESPNPHGHTQQPSQVQTERERDWDRCFNCEYNKIVVNKILYDKLYGSVHLLIPATYPSSQSVVEMNMQFLFSIFHSDCNHVWAGTLYRSRQMRDLEHLLLVTSFLLRVRPDQTQAGCRSLWMCECNEYYQHSGK